MTHAPRRRRFRFSLATLFAGVTVLAVVAAISRSAERREIAGMIWTLCWWGFLCYAIVKLVRRGDERVGADRPQLPSARSGTGGDFERG